MTTDFSPGEQRLFMYMLNRKEHCYIIDMYKVIMGQNSKDLLFHPDEVVSNPEHRKMQQHVGTYVSAINKKLKHRKIVPGHTKRTYVLVSQ